MDKDGREVFVIKNDLQNGYNAHSQLCKLANELKETESTEISIDISRVRFIASNLFAVLGCILAEFVIGNGENALLLSGINPTIRETTQKNGFCRHIGLKKIPDVHNTVIPYRIFNVDEIIEYERYLTLSLFNRKDLPKMTKLVSDNIRDSLLELFKNVKDHTSSKKIYTCGQYFPKSNLIFFTIVDSGETIPYNVEQYLIRTGSKIEGSSLQWAISEGTTTLESKGPRGIGLYLIKDFVLLNKGNFYIVSGNETYEITSKGDRYCSLEYPFPGTMVTIGFNLNDDATYCMSSEKNTTIQF